MIYTLTLNPAIDYIAYTDGLALGKINRSHGERLFFGGKGINVSIILHELGVKSVATGFIAGFTGDAIECGVSHMGITTDFVRLSNGFSRINVKLRSGAETDINGQGPSIQICDLDRLMQRLDLIADGDTLVLAGSIPPTLPDDTYERIMQRLSGRNIDFVVDATGELLLRTLKYRPFLIKPNNDELGELFGVGIGSVDDAFYYAEKLQAMGARNVLVSMGENGAALLCESGEKLYRKAHSGNVINTVGAGDSMIAGFLAGYVQTRDFSYALSLGSAAGSATAFSEGLADRSSIISLLNCTEQK